MSFKFSDAHIADFSMLGFTVFRSIVPSTLVSDLRKATDQAREIARARSGPQVQRLQPIAKFDIDQKPFQEFGELPDLQDAITRVLTPRHTYATQDYLGVLLEPADLPYCTPWHRDWRDNVAGLKLSDWEAGMTDIHLYNQYNCALYEDTSTWLVPGSHARRDLPGEAQRFPDRPIPGPNLEGLSSAARERACLEYCRSMPGAICVHLNEGDFALYRSTLWHLGNYAPYRKRATLHDVVDTPEYVEWRERFAKPVIERRAAGAQLKFENPNAH